MQQLSVLSHAAYLYNFCIPMQESHAAIYCCYYHDLICMIFVYLYKNHMQQLSVRSHAAYLYSFCLPIQELHAAVYCCCHDYIYV